MEALYRYCRCEIFRVSYQLHIPCPLFQSSCNRWPSGMWGGMPSNHMKNSKRSPLPLALYLLTCLAWLVKMQNECSWNDANHFLLLSYFHKLHLCLRALWGTQMQGNCWMSSFLLQEKKLSEDNVKDLSGDIQVRGMNLIAKRRPLT